MKRYNKLVILLTSLMLAAGFTMKAYAEPICIAITAEVVYVDDLDGVLGNAIEVGDVITGNYVYESTTPDTNYFPTVGDYWHTTAPFGITLNAGGFVFRTDPNNVDFLVEIANDSGTPASDVYVLISYNNIFDVGSISNNLIVWQLEDPTGAALSSEALPTVPPVLADWQSFFGLDIRSGDYKSEIFVRSHVTSAKLCPLGDECITDADCNDDGVFCNGTETCLYGNCVAVSACPPHVFGCVIRGSICDEDNDQCLDFADDSRCDIGQTCDVITGECLTPCRISQQAAQEAVASGGTYKNKGQILKTATNSIIGYLSDKVISKKCFGCILSQFARRIPIDKQQACE